MIIKNDDQTSQKIWKAGFYIRLSREDVENEILNSSIKVFNKTESESITSQRVILTDFVKKFDDINLIQEYVDDGYSGTNFSRPSFQKLIDDIRLKKINCVIVKDLSRFGRNYAEVGNFLEVFFPMLDVRFISIIDNCDSFLKPESVSNIIVPVKNIMNESYCKDISMKVRSAFDARKKQGLFVGTYATFGYKKDSQNHNKLVIDEKASQVVKRIFQDFVNGKTLNKIACSLNVEDVLCPAKYKNANGVNKYVKSFGDKIGWKDNSVRRILSNPIYIGTLVQKYREKINYKIKKFREIPKEKRIVVENVTEPIIEKDLFYKAQDLLNRDTRISKKSENLDLLSGFLHCGDCKHGMSKKNSRSGTSKTKFITYYNCSNYKRCGKAICSPHSIRKDEIENVVFEYLKMCVNLAINFSYIIEFINKFKSISIKTDNLENVLKNKQLEKMAKQQFIDDLYPDYKSGIISEQEYTRYKEKANSELAKIETDLTLIQKQIEKIKQGTMQNNQFISHFLKYQNIEKLDRQMVVEFVDNIWVHENHFVEIDLKFKDEFNLAKSFIESNKNVLAYMKNAKSVIFNA